MKGVHNHADLFSINDTLDDDEEDMASKLQADPAQLIQPRDNKKNDDGIFDYGDYEEDEESSFEVQENNDYGNNQMMQIFG